jgi:ATP-binding cassette subfamily C protein
MVRLEEGWWRADVSPLLLLLTVQITALRIEGWAGTRNQEAIMDRLLRLPMRFFGNYTAGNPARRVLAIQVLQKAAGGAMISFLLTGTLPCSPSG